MTRQVVPRVGHGRWAWLAWVCWYFLAVGVARAQTCTCSNGSPATDCTSGGAKCASCNNGFYLNGAACKTKVCTCSGGTGATGTACPAHNTAKCVSCKKGFLYYKSEDTCQACGSGRYQGQDETTEQNCMLCGEGKYAPSTTTNSCQECGSGRYQGQTEATEHKGKACGNSCISRSKRCHKGRGCACDS